MAQKIKYLTQDEVRRLLTKIDSRRDKALFKMMYDFGLRISEVGKLTIRDIDFERGRIWIERLKGGVSGEYAIFRDTLKLINLYLQERNSDLYPWLFYQEKRTHYPNGALILYSNTTPRRPNYRLKNITPTPCATPLPYICSMPARSKKP